LQADAATAEAEEVRDEDGQQARATALQLSKTQDAVPQRDNEKGSDAPAAAARRAGEDEDEDEEVELPMPGSFDFEDTTAVLQVWVSSIHSMRSVYGNGRQKYCSWFHRHRASGVRENGRR
jgi:hypothetical protein